MFSYIFFKHFGLFFVVIFVVPLTFAQYCMSVCGLSAGSHDIPLRLGEQWREGDGDQAREFEEHVAVFGTSSPMEQSVSVLSGLRG